MIRKARRAGCSLHFAAAVSYHIGSLKVDTKELCNMHMTSTRGFCIMSGHWLCMFDIIRLVPTAAG